MCEILNLDTTAADKVISNIAEKLKDAEPVQIVGGFSVTIDKDEKIDPKKNFYTKSQKSLMVQEQLEKLKTAFKQLDPNTYIVVQNLIESVAFMSVELKDLEGVISTNGQIETYRNGAYQTGYKKSASSEAYNSMKKTYLADIKVLADLIGANAKDFNDELMDFIQRKK